MAVQRWIKKERNILYIIKIRKVNCIDHILRMNCLLPRVIEGKTEGRTEVTGRRERRHRQLPNDLEEKKGYWKLKQEALDCNVWRTCFEGLWTGLKRG
jgi:hypothetical protein